MLNKKLISLAVVLGLGVSTVAFAQWGQHHLARIAAQYDTDGNGEVTIQEIQAGRSAEFSQYDSDGNAGLSLQELQTLMQNKRTQNRATRLAEMDSDGNGVLSVAEFQAGHRNPVVAATLFGLADTDQSATLDVNEMAELKSQQGRLWRQFAHIDADGDGIISETEFSNHMPMKRGRGHRGHGRGHGQGHGQGHGFYK